MGILDKLFAPSKEGEQQKREAIETFLDGRTAGLVDAKALAKAYTPEGINDSKTSAFRLSGGLKRHGAGILGAAAIMASLGTAGYFWNKKRMKKQLRDEIEKSSSYTIEVFNNTSGLVKYASNGLAEVKSIMRRIYEEDPSYWPYGLDTSNHDSVYLIRDAMTKEAAGFVGWQVLRENGRKVGSYSIGILPEYRSKGFAKEAVARVIQKKAASVDEVRSYICSHNYRSKGLANSLGIKIQEKF